MCRFKAKKETAFRIFSDSSLNFFDVSLLQKFKGLYSLHIFCIDCSKFVVSSRFSGFYTPQSPSKIGVIESFIYLSSSLSGTRPSISHTLIFPAFRLLFYPTVFHRITQNVIRWHNFYWFVVRFVVKNQERFSLFSNEEHL